EHTGGRRSQGGQVRHPGLQRPGRPGQLHARGQQYLRTGGALNMRLQSGQALLELLLTLAISALVSVWAVQRWQAHLQEQQLQNWAGWLLEVRQGVQRYMDAHASELLADAAALPGYADPWSPGLAELAAQGWLPRGLSSMPLNWPGLQIQLTPQGDCPGACRLDALLL